MGAKLVVMLLKEVESPEELPKYEQSGKWVSQQKADGDHFVASFKNGNVRLINRHNNDYTAQFPEIVRGLGISKDKEVVLNGEIAYWDSKRKIFDFNTFRGRQGIQSPTEIKKREARFPCKLYVFDLIEYDGIKMANNPEYPFSKRFELLQKIVKDNAVTELLPIRTDLTQHFKEECEAEREGIVLKNLGNIYFEGRADSVLKCKNWNFTPIEFNKFTPNNAGITLENDFGDRVLVAGKKAELVRAILIQTGGVNCMIRHLQGRTDNNRLREPTFKEVLQ